MDSTERVAHRVKLRDLRLFESVVRLGSIAKAANQLNLTQPAASKAIAQLEHAIGFRLLDRNTRGVEPTHYGRALLKRGMAIFDELRLGVQEIEFLADPTVGEVRIGTTDGMMAGVFPAVLERLCRKFPKITFHVPQVAMTPHQYRQLRERNIDLILGRLVMPVDDDLHGEVLFYDRTLVVAGSHNPWCRRRNIKLAELIDEPWAIPTEGLVGTLLAEAFRASGLNPPRAGVKSSSVQLAGALLARGSHLTVLPASALRFSTVGSSLRALPVKLDIPPWPTGIVTLKNRTISPVTQLFIDCARETTKPLAKQTRV